MGTAAVPAFSGAAGLTRLFASEMGGQISWLLPAALIALVAGLLWLTWRRPRTDRLRAAALLWGGWLLVTGLVFSYMNGIIHPYYTVALAPAIAALAGIGAVAAWRARSALGVRLILAAAVLVTAWWAYSLLDRSASCGCPGSGCWWWRAGWPPPRSSWPSTGWAARPGPCSARYCRSRCSAGWPGRSPSQPEHTAATGHTGALPSAGPSVAFAVRRPGRRVRPSWGGLRGWPYSAAFYWQPQRYRRLGWAAARLRHLRTAVRAWASGQFPGGTGSTNGRSPGGPAGRFASGTGRRWTGGRPWARRPGRGDTQVSSAITRLLISGVSGYRWAAATVGAESAAPFQLASGEPLMAIGGFNGTDAAPSLAEFKKLVAAHEIHSFIAANGNTFGGAADAEAITTWVTSHFAKQTVGGETVYNLANANSS